MLQGIASPPDSDGTVYFYDAHDGQDLQNALAQISARLTDVRLSM